MMRVSDYIFKRLVEKYRVEHVFMITGGGAMHLNDAIGRCAGLKYTCNHHEQACAIAAEAYARSTGRLAVVNVTTGPGGLNTLTGLMGQWTDSVPVLYISGQVKQQTTITHYPRLRLRQLGDQEVDIIEVVKPLTKFAKQITSLDEVKSVLDEAVDRALSGRPGPVWIDVPMDIQGMIMDEKIQKEYSPSSIKKEEPDLTLFFEWLEKAERPVFVAGHGIKIAKAADRFRALAEKFHIPVLTTFNGMDILEEENPNYIGRIGTLGSRAGNFALQNADLVITIGSRNNIRQVSYNWEYYVRAGKHVVVDIDPEELRKPTVRVDMGICADAGWFIDRLGAYTPRRSWPDWLAWCQARKQRYPTVSEEYKYTKERVQPYYFMRELTRRLSDKSTVVAGNGTACVVLFQAGEVKKGQQYIWNSGCASMGYDLPAAIGVAVAHPERQIICLAGDGSLMMNLQEMATMAYYKLPIKLIVLDNHGYISIKQTQDNFFAGQYIGCNEDSGVGFPDFVKLGTAFGIKTLSIASHEEMERVLPELLRDNTPMVCVVNLLDDYKFIPKTSSVRKEDGRMVSKPLEDLYPFLSREEFLENMIIKPLNE
ncbi:thiamine pyrophosphate-binding protein [Gabonibacter chumensis]|uniref:thiamine pyrophosphate-binding protein n=1 Tax=Gabonibacter chumensis TaxID=2972474 RepID=UPI002572FE5E|nr:thiamine pyrophosphate-binding protein [Gabonibacter chumensis]MCR9011313.1 thiamine pyrophosphate-binding protein [Gabonibacter chumensis]